jgi:NADPH:quinone reductase-like Zn-dependent oxidoreductase
MLASVGTVVIQLAKLSGMTVLTTTSPKNAEYLKSLGADYVFPYNDPSTPRRNQEDHRRKTVPGL